MKKYDYCEVNKWIIKPNSEGHIYDLRFATIELNDLLTEINALKNGREMATEKESAKLETALAAMEMSSVQAHKIADAVGRWTSEAYIAHGKACAYDDAMRLLKKAGVNFPNAAGERLPAKNI